MAQNDYSGVQQRKSRDIDAGLQAHMQRIYNIMALGLLVTAVAAYIAAGIPALQMALVKAMSNPFLGLLVGISPFLLISFMFAPQKLPGKSMGQLTGAFIGISAYWGVLLSVLFMVYDPTSIVKTFFVTAATFAAMSIYGYTTKRDLSGMGSFMAMGAIGVFFAIILNLFLQSPMLHMLISAVGVIVYTGLMAWDTQYIKESYSPASGDAANKRLAMLGAVRLYINFIMLFQFLLQFMGNRN